MKINFIENNRVRALVGPNNCASEAFDKYLIGATDEYHPRAVYSGDLYQDHEDAMYGIMRFSNLENFSLTIEGYGELLDTFIDQIYPIWRTRRPLIISPLLYEEHCDEGFIEIDEIE